MKKICLILCVLLSTIGIISCKKTNDNDGPLKHKIEYILDGGINHPNNPTEYTEGSPVTLQAPSKQGYDFIGWFMGDTKIVTIGKEYKTDLTVTAKWKLKIPMPTTHKIEYILDGGVNNENNPSDYAEGTPVTLQAPTKQGYSFVGWFINGVQIDVISGEDKEDLVVTAKWELANTDNVSIVLNGPEEVKSGNTIQLNAEVTGTPNTSVTWKITQGNEYATIDSNGKLKAKSVDSNQKVTVVVTSDADSTKEASKEIEIISKPKLTQEMINVLRTDRISYEGYVEVSLYSIGLFEKLESTYNYITKTAMDGTNWYSEYDNGATGTKMGLYVKNHNNIACNIGISFMNDEQYEPMLDNYGKTITWLDSGLYNNFYNLNVSDFKFNETTWRYDYVGSDTKMAEKIISSANPYNFVVNGFSLLLEDDEIIGIYAKSGADYSISTGYKGYQELVVVINCGETVEVPQLARYNHEEFHDELATAVTNMKNLSSYKLNFREVSYSYLSSTPNQSGFSEIITADNCYFDPYTLTLDSKGEAIEVYKNNDSYGYRKINNNLYNRYSQNEDGTYEGVRAYEESFEKTKPSFAFAAEIFPYHNIQEDGSIIYLVDDVMSSVASTFFYGVGNDINLYGIFATRYNSGTISFTPYVVVKDGYIIESGFYYYMGSMYGLVEIKYSDFNEATISNDILTNLSLNFKIRNVPTSWSELSIIVSNDDGTMSDDKEENALEFLKKFYDNENIEEIMPFFGNALGDTYGFGLTTIHLPGGSDTAYRAVQLYYDVPLDIDYTINSSLKSVENYLLNLGFTKNKYNEFNKGNIWVYPFDSSLDLVIYIWKG